ncbi:uncharacterized protein LOC111710006 [Eurytemora carolleeae]|uniref:uncharacterized protein LOC111710006 n=1 Tax=Eurytemora carolleeae TaxID=1294199 RepID=UPI000C76C38C|nr:uncharacterized protein LOC111710006 [Eurytemora carolleeae]|eukprot:XP_023339770.1 uncharacterized protein LOC111710006 [Eurytemora affinis]
MAGGTQQYTQHYKSCQHDTRNKLGSRLITIKKSPFRGFFQKMGTKLSCSCGPLKIKGYRFDDPWATNTRSKRDGHLLRLWAEVFHVTTGGSGSVKWQQDGSRSNSASRMRAKAASSRSTPVSPSRGREPQCTCSHPEQTGRTSRLQQESRSRGVSNCNINGIAGGNPANGSAQNGSKRKPMSTSTPSSPTRDRKVQCTCMTPEQFAHLHRYQHANSKSDLRSSSRGSREDLTTATAPPQQQNHNFDHKEKPRRTEGFGSVRDKNITREGFREIPDTRGHVSRGHNGSSGTSTGSLKSRRELTKSEYNIDTKIHDKVVSKQQRSKSIDQLNSNQGKSCHFDSGTLKKMLTPVNPSESPLTSPEVSRRGRSSRGGSYDSDRDGGFMSEPDMPGRSSIQNKKIRQPHVGYRDIFF